MNEMLLIAFATLVMITCIASWIALRKFNSFLSELHRKLVKLSIQFEEITKQLEKDLAK